MANLILFVFFLIIALMWFFQWALIISAVLSWLVAFEIINLRNRAVHQIAHFLDAVTRPLLAPLRKVIPPLGGVDLSPLVLILIIIGARVYLVVPLRDTLLQMFG